MPVPAMQLRIPPHHGQTRHNDSHAGCTKNRHSAFFAGCTNFRHFLLYNENPRMYPFDVDIRLMSGESGRLLQGSGRNRRCGCVKASECGGRNGPLLQSCDRSAVCLASPTTVLECQFRVVQWNRQSPICWQATPWLTWLQRSWMTFCNME